MSTIYLAKDFEHLSPQAVRHADGWQVHVVGRTTVELVETDGNTFRCEGDFEVEPWSLYPVGLNPHVLDKLVGGLEVIGWRVEIKPLT